ncbi:NFACT family protein [Candidatus Woesearchaeota archaeon]|nr:NFACT family protein [Candidatus Woesearchaeota archaeon]
MKKQLSSIDLHFLAKEFGQLKDTRIDKIYQPEQNLIVFSLHKASSGKRILVINIGQSIFIAEEKEDFGETLGFGMFLRKHLDGFFLTGIEQLKPERILKFTFKAKEEEKYLYIEFFGKGNAILCNENNVILNALEHHDFRERSVKPKLKYVYPIMSYNLFDLKENDSINLFKNSKKESVIVSLATELGLGGLYSEEVCLLGNVDKNTNPANIDEKQMHSILNSIKKIISHDIEAKAVIENVNVIDFIPFDFVFYSDKRYEKKGFDSFNSAVAYFYSQFKEVKETEYDRKLKSLQHIIGQQKLTIEEMKKEEKESREKGEAIYHNYQMIKEVLEELNKASKKYSWKEIKEKLKGHKTIKEVNEKERKVVVEV